MNSYSGMILVYIISVPYYIILVISFGAIVESIVRHREKNKKDSN